MKKIFFSILAVTFVMTACKTNKEADHKHSDHDHMEAVDVLGNATHSVSTENTTVKWEGFKPTGSHHGTVPVKEGGVIFKDGALEQGEFVLQMSDLNVSDLQDDEEMHGKLVGHLKSPDFFGTEAHPTAIYKFSAIDNNQLEGSLTIKGITNPLTIPVTISEANGVVRIQAEPFKVDRTAYDIKYKSKKFFSNLADKFINDEFEISFDVMLK